eukprot:TRINITY_DN12675_c0_g1_i1.p1 TRINITY_DN12675_c0_g1~~TRINITY_DN12675_c0_g1_i1.p1  ORF type:complete len:1042 (+),score=265.85 TRINITY_DN12675_c0_g1_i1:60-3185(+)
MAFMSEVTHGKLVGKYTATPDGIGGEHMTYTADTERSSVIGEGIVGCGSFNAQVRCCAPFGSASSIRQATCWTGESDGSLTIRQAWSGEVVNNVERKAGVFVTCLKHSGNMMYAGMSDGYLRAFESSPSGDDYTLMSEARKHTGDILCIETVGSNIFTGARDWQVFVWRWDDEVLRAVDQFAGHQLAVRCLAYADGYLYSGGDEGVIRCIHMETGKEIMTCESAVPGFPIGQNKGGIKSLCVVDNVFFSGDEENINVWEAKTGNHLRLLLKSEGAVLTLMKDPCGNRVWSGGVDGVIRLWSAVDFTLLCSLNDHNGSFVRGLVPLTRVSSTKAWTINKDGELQLWYTESDCSEFVETTSREERRLTTTIMNLRESIVNNYAKLEGHKQDLKKSESLEASRKKALAEAFFRSGNVCLNRKYFGKLMSMLQARKRQKKSAILCNALHTSTGQERRAVYYGKLAKFAKQRADYKKNQKFAECILSNTEKTLQIVYYRKLKEYTRRATLKHKKEALAASLQRNTTGGLQRSTLFKWMRWDQKRRHTKKRRTISHAMFRHTKNGLLFIYYAKLVAYYKREREEVRKGTLTDTLLRTLYRSMRHAYYMKWLKWFKRKSDAGRRKRVAHILMRTTCHGTLRLYWSKWMEWRLSGMHRALESKYDEMQKNVKKLELKLKAAKFVTEEDLRKQVSDLDNEAAKLEKELEMLEGKADSLEDECQKLDMEANGFLHHDPSQPIQEQLVHVCAYLKARGVSCRHDIRTISDTTGKKERGVPVFTNGLSRLKKALVQAGCTKSSHHWGCTSDRIKQLERKYLQESHKGIKEIIIGVDQMRYYKSTFPVDLCQEVLDNIHVLYEVVTRIYGDRMAHDMNDLRVAQKMRENDPYATQHGKLINDKKSNTFLERQARSKEGSLREKVRSKESNPPVPRRSGTPTPRAGSTEPSEPATARSLISPPMSSRSARPSPGFKVGDNLRVIAITSDRAKHSGLQTGDVITAVNNVVVSDKTQYVGRVKMTVPGDVVTISFTRNGVKAKTIRMAMGEMERSVR